MWRGRGGVREVDDTPQHVQRLHQNRRPLRVELSRSQLEVVRAPPPRHVQGLLTPGAQLEPTPAFIRRRARPWVIRSLQIGSIVALSFVVPPCPWLRLAELDAQ